MAKYLVTGAAGFIGSSLVRALLERGDEVRGVDNFSTGRRDNLSEVLQHMDFREADILDLDAMHRRARESIMCCTRPPSRRSRNR
jgi:nucleoside-diphosphate-sugar epimerase